MPRPLFPTANHLWCWSQTRDKYRSTRDVKYVQCPARFCCNVDVFPSRVNVFFVQDCQVRGRVWPRPHPLKTGLWSPGGISLASPQDSCRLQGLLPEGLVPSTVGSDITFSLLRAGFYPPAACALAWLEANLPKNVLWMRICWIKSDLVNSGLT